MSKEQRISFNNILLTIALIFCIPSAYLNSMYIFKKIYIVGQILVFIVCLIVFLKRKKISKYLLLIISFYIIYIFSTIINNNNPNIIIRNMITCFSLLYISEFLITQDSAKYYQMTLMYFKIINIINLITICLFPSGIYVGSNTNPHYFLGQRNDSIEFLLPMVTFEIIYSGITRNNKESNSNKIKFTALLSFVTVILTWSANAIVAIFLLCIIVFSNKDSIIRRVLTYKNLILMYFSMFFGFVIFRVQEAFAWFFTNILHKSLTFTNRTIIWDKSIYNIKKSILYGYGYEPGIIKISKIGHANSCHNYILDFMYYGGIAMLVLIIIMLIIIGKKLYENKNNMINKNLIGVMGGYFMLWFATPIHLNTISLMFLVFFIIMNQEKKLQEKKKVEKK